MNVNTNIRIDLVKPWLIPPVAAMQNDAETRTVTIQLMENGTAWEIPDDALPMVVYSKLSGVSGQYDTVSGKSAFEVDGSKITVTFASQLLTSPGLVTAAVVFRSASGKRLSTFPFAIDVRPSPNADGAPEDTGSDSTGGASNFVLPTATVTQTADGATISVTDKNGTTTATVKNGKDGSDASVTAHSICKALGYTAVNPDKLSLAIHTDGLLYIFVDGQRVGNGVPMAGGGDVVGWVDSANNIVVSGKLADGSYTVKYEMADGGTVDIGDLVIGAAEPDEPIGPSYTNLADPSSTEWKNGYKISSAGIEEPSTGVTLVNTIAAHDGDIVRIKGMTGVITGLYKNGAWYARKTVNATNFNDGNTIVDGDFTQFNPSDACNELSAIRFYGALSGTAADVIVTVNEEIV